MVKIYINFSVIVILLCGDILWACQSKQTKERENPETHDIDTPVLHSEIISSPNNTFGYNILKNGKIYIHQPHIPVVSGNKGFKTETRARKAAEFVISKIDKNIIPPTITAAELDSLGVLD